jgi:hypothetical protein
LEDAVVGVELEGGDPGVIGVGERGAGGEPGQEDLGFARGRFGAGVVERGGGFEVEEAIARVGAVDAAAAVGSGESFEIGFGIAAE